MVTLIAKVNTFFLCRLLRRPRTKKAKAQGEEGPPGHSTGAPTFVPPPGPTPFTKGIENRCEPAQRLRPLLPRTCGWPPSDDIQVIDATPFSSGSFAEVWKGSVQGQIVAIKSLRCYSSPGFDPSGVGIVSFFSPVYMVRVKPTVSQQRFVREVWASTQLSHRNIVPFIGVYSTPAHPFALLYGMMDNIDLGRYLVERPDASRLKLVSTALTIHVADPLSIPHPSSSLKYRGR